MLNETLIDIIHHYVRFIQDSSVCNLQCSELNFQSLLHVVSPTLKGFQDYVKRKGYLLQCTQIIFGLTFNLHSVSVRASKLPTRVSEADWGRVAESGVGQSRGEAR